MKRFRIPLHRRIRLKIRDLIYCLEWNSEIGHLCLRHRWHKANHQWWNTNNPKGFAGNLKEWPKWPAGEG